MSHNRLIRVKLTGSYHRLKRTNVFSNLLLEAIGKPSLGAFELLNSVG